MLPEGVLKGPNTPDSILTESGRRERLGPLLDLFNGGNQNNRAQEAKQNQTNVDYNPTYNLDLSQLERQQRRDMERLKQHIEKLEREIRDVGP
ncbi:hypothetical protein ACFQH6_20705 [Halobacteriaceae archaeon GCM10025711]